MYNKTIIRFGFCDIQNNRGLGKGYQPQPSASADKGRTSRKVMGGGGGGEFSACTNLFFCSLPVQEFFFRVKPSARIFFFQANIAFFSVKSRFIIYFALNKLFYTHNRSKDTGHFLILCARSFRKCTERGGSNPEWTASLCIFAVPAFWISSVIKMG